MVETQAACFCNSGSTLKACLMTFTPVGEASVLRLSFDIQDRNGYSLPPYQPPMVLPLKSVGFLMPVSARRDDVRAARLHRDVKPGVLVEALLLGDVVAGELRLRDPFELNGDGIGGLG